MRSTEALADAYGVLKYTLHRYCQLCKLSRK